MFRGFLVEVFRAPRAFRVEDLGGLGGLKALSFEAALSVSTCLKESIQIPNTLRIRI